MKRFMIAAAIIILSFSAPTLVADIGISLNVGQPGFYGRLNIGDYPQPQVIYSQPIAIERVPMDRPPIYLRVPPGHVKQWAKHCREYDACGERVFFVQDGWYNREYAPRYQENQRDGEHEGRGEHMDRHPENRRNEGHGNQRGRGFDR